MKSSTLRFTALLPLLTLLVLLLLTQQRFVNALRPDKMSTKSVTSETQAVTTNLANNNKRATSTTTQKPPSLRAPRLMRTPPPTTVMTRTPTTTTKTSTTTAVKKSEALRARQHATRTNTARHSVPHTKVSITETAQTSSRRQTRTADRSTSINTRPNRSYLSAAATANNHINYSAEALTANERNADERNANKAVTQNNSTIKNNSKENDNNNKCKNNKNHTKVSVITAPVIPPSTTSLSPSEASDMNKAAEINVMPNKAMTIHQNQPSLQRQSKQIRALSTAQRARSPHDPDLNGASNDRIVHSARLPQTPKTPRMIQRLAAGHIHNDEGHSTYRSSVATKNGSVSISTSTQRPTITHYVRTKGGQLAMSSSYRSVKVSTTSETPTNIATTTAKATKTIGRPLHLSKQRDAVALNTDDTDDNDDEALLDDEGDFDNWDNGILRLSAGSGKESGVKSKKNKDESKKTLSDQVRDGKYGLIEKELFRRPPKRPGVLSYLPNKETPIDNEHTFGGLNEEDIWLAEDHLLVIKGGSLNKGEPDEPWPPIDDYDAPERPIKLPLNPKVPPPFPVQLEENGPLQFIGNNKFTVVYPIANESLSVYPVGPETNNASPENDSDNEKNLITRPGTPQDIAQGEPGFLYPAPYPPWLYHNQTFVNPFLNNARPITFPNLGPFPLGRSNGSLENSNGTDYFDEDDPSLYYPPAYSFVFKNNYTNPVPPGPLVPGIVLPPPPNQFSRLEKTEKIQKVPHHRNRGYGATSTSTSSTSTTTTTTTTSTLPTTTTSTTTQAPYHPKVITKIHHYSPKTIIITPEPPVDVLLHHVMVSPNKLPPPRTSSAPPLAPTAVPPEIIEPIPVPVAIHVPIFPVNKYPQARPNSLAFEGTTPRNNQETLSKSNPIYYEYFEAKRQPNSVTSNAIDDFLSTTEKPVLAKPIKLYATSKRPFKSQLQSQRTYLPPQLQLQPHPQRQYLPQDVLYITPRPEAVRYKRPPTQSPVSVEAPVYKSRPLENFEEEVNAIRQTLRYYENQQLRDNNIPRTPKAKPIYEFNFDATKNLQSAKSTASTGDFQPPTEYDETPFKPMVTYSPPVDDENSFHAIAVDKTDTQHQLQHQQQKQQQEYGQQQAKQQQQPRYQSSTTLIPVQPEAPYQQVPTGRPKKVRLGAKYLQQAPLYAEYRSADQELLQYPSTPRSHTENQTPWVSINQQQHNLNEYAPPSPPQPSQYQRIERPHKQRGFNGYYYNDPPQHTRLNNRFYEEPFQQVNARRIIKYRQQSPPPPPLPPQQTEANYQQQQQEQPQTLWSLENDTYVNYAPNRPPLNPDAEFINPYQSALPLNPYPAQLQRYNSQQAPPPPLSHQSQYYAPPQQQLQPLPQQQQQQQQQQQGHYPQQIPLHRDILVNYRQPLPPINPDSEYISHPQVVRQQVYSPALYRPNSYQRIPPHLPPQLIATGEQDGLYYISPKYRRSNNNNDNNSNKQTNDDKSQNNHSAGSDDKSNAHTNTPTRGNKENHKEGRSSDIESGSNTDSVKK